MEHREVTWPPRRRLYVVLLLVAITPTVVAFFTQRWWLIAVSFVLMFAVMGGWEYWAFQQRRLAQEQGTIIDWKTTQWRREARFGKVMSFYFLAPLSALLIMLSVYVLVK